MRFELKNVFLSLLLVAALIMLQGIRTRTVDATTGLTISEIRIDQPGADRDEYFELAGPPGTALDGLTYVVIGDGGSSQGSGVIEVAVDLSSGEIPDSGYLVVAESSFSLGQANLTTSLNFENGDNVTHLLVRGLSGTNGDDLDLDDDGTLDVFPWTELIDLVALIEEENPPAGTEFHYGPPAVGPDGSVIPSYVFRCLGGWEIGQPDTAAQADTPGAANHCATASLVINEIDYDQVGPDTAEFIELKNVDPGAVNLALYSLDLINGEDATAYRTFDLPDVDLAAGDYYVVCGDSATVANCDLDVSPDRNLIQNGAPDAVALRLNDGILDTVSFEGDVGEPYTEGSGSGLADDPNVDGIGISRFPDGADTDQNNLDLSPRCITPGEASTVANTNCVLAADLQISSSDDPDPVAVGDDVRYTITVVNNGPNLATNVVVTDTLPATVIYGMAFPNQGNCTALAGVVTCSLGELESGSSLVVDILVTTTLGGTISNGAGVTSDTDDPNPENNSVLEETAVAVPEIVNDLLYLERVDTVFKPQPVPDAPAGVMTISASFINNSSTAIQAPFFRIAKLTGNNILLNADAGPGGVGASISVGPEALGGTTTLDSGDSFTMVFEIGLAERRRFTFAVDAYGTPIVEVGDLAIRSASDADSFHFRIVEQQIQAGQTLYLPIIIKLRPAD